MKITWEFDPYEDRDELILARNSRAYYACLFGFEQEIRQIWKHEELTDEEYKMIERVREIFCRTLEEHTVDLDEVS